MNRLLSVLKGMSVELAEKVHLLFMVFFRFPPSPLSQEGLHLSLLLAFGRPLSRLSQTYKYDGVRCSIGYLSSGEGKIENFENPSFSKFWYRSRSLCPKGRAMRYFMRWISTWMRGMMVMGHDNAIRIVKVWRNPSRWFLKCIFCLMD